MSASDLMQKDMATEKKEERINQAEMEKQEAREHNAAAKESATGGHVTEGKTATTGPGAKTATHHPAAMGANQMPAMHGHGYGSGLGLTHELLTEDVMGSHPTGTNTGMGSTAAHNVHVVGGTGPRSGPNI